MISQHLIDLILALATLVTAIGSAWGHLHNSSKIKAVRGAHEAGAASVHDRLTAHEAVATSKLESSSMRERLHMTSAPRPGTPGKRDE